jgi:hypothetical protein
MMATYGANEFMENPNEIGVRVKGDPVFVSCEPEDDDTQEIDPPVEVGDAAT